MAELVAWGLGLGLGYTVTNVLTSRLRILLFGIVILLLGGLITLLSGEMESEPWLVIVDIGQVAIAALIGAYVLPFALRQLERTTKSATR